MLQNFNTRNQVNGGDTHKWKSYKGELFCKKGECLFSFMLKLTDRCPVGSFSFIREFVYSHFIVRGKNPQIVLKSPIIITLENAVLHILHPSIPEVEFLKHF